MREGCDSVALCAGTMGGRRKLRAGDGKETLHIATDRACRDFVYDENPTSYRLVKMTSFFSCSSQPRHVSTRGGNLELSRLTDKAQIHFSG